MGRTERYVLDLVEQILGPAERGKRFEWALGDPSRKTGRQARLPFDAVWEQRRLIIEVDEDQHTETTPIFDKPNQLTVSGVHRGEQRRLYDERKRAAAKAQGYNLVAISWSRTRRRRPGDLAEIRRLLEEASVAVDAAGTTDESNGLR
jgi:very-short-patch-repair endonuclease